MAYSDFTLEEIDEKLDIKNIKKRLFSATQPLAPNERLLEALETAAELPLRSEKAKSEWVIVPILDFLRKRNNKFFTIYSGDNLLADSALGLNGECAFILAKDTQSSSINYPIFQIVEAKKHDIDQGIAQCAAQLIGADIFNKKRHQQLDKIYGCVTIRNEWIFLYLSDNQIFIDTKIYFINELPLLLGVFQEIIDYYKKLFIFQ